MTVHSIERHKLSLVNRKAYLTAMKNEMELKLQTIKRLENDIAFAEYQINCAEAEHKPGFDDERYKKNYKWQNHK